MLANGRPPSIDSRAAKAGTAAIFCSYLRRHFADGVEIGDVTGGAGLTSDIDDVALDE